MDIHKSWSTLELKSVSDDQRIIKGLASSPKTDRDGDILEPGGAKFSLPFPLLSQHDHTQPIGQVVAATITSKGIEIEAHIVKDSGLDYVERAWRQIKAGLIRGLSVGFRAIKAEPIAKGYHFKEWDLYELSAVTVPANAACSILTVKHYDASPANDLADDVMLKKLERNLSINRATQAIIAAKRTLKGY